MPDPKKPYVIVVGIDYFETGDLAFSKALELAAQRPRAELHVVHVMPLNLPALASDIAITNVPQTENLARAAETLESYVERKLTAYRAGQAGDATLPGLRVVPHLRTDSPAYEIAQIAADLDADLVVVGTHGRRAMSRVLLGSVAEVTVRLSPCPVLVVRPKTLSASIPAIEPPCPRCVEARTASGGKEFWCEQHRETHGQRHTYHQGDRTSAETNMPLVVR